MATYVLVHGSYQGGWIWKDVASRLRAAGHDVYAPSLDGCAERKGAVRPGITTESQADDRMTETQDRIADQRSGDVPWDLLGLLGLAGLLGLRRQSDNDGYTDDPIE